MHHTESACVLVKAVQCKDTAEQGQRMLMKIKSIDVKAIENW